MRELIIGSLGGDKLFPANLYTKIKGDGMNEELFSGYTLSVTD
jgi:hypothetical protein